MKSLNKFASWLALVLMAALCQFSASAAITPFTDSGSFTAALQTGYYLENFTSAPDVVYGPPSPPHTFSGGTPNFSYTITSPGNGGAGSVDVGGSRAISTFTENDVLTITFTGIQPTAIGGNFFWTDLSGAATAGSVRVRYGGDSEFIDVPLSGGGSFAGITTDNALGFFSISMSLVGYTSGLYFPTVDNFYVGNATPVPEAGTWVAGAFIGLFVVTRTGWGILRRRLARQ